MKVKINGKKQNIVDLDQPIMNDLQSVMILEGITNRRDYWSHYSFQGINVPRVSEILEATIGKTYLIKWALTLGDRYYKETKDTFAIGSFVHDMIEYYLRYHEDMEPEIYSDKIRDTVYVAYNNYKLWQKNKEAHGYTITPLEIEYPIVTPYYGGTCDCIMNISKNGISRNYLMDFKTSKQISVDYFLQIYFYLWGLNWLRQYCDPNIPIIDGGIGVIRVDKFTPDLYEDSIIQFSDIKNNDFMNYLDYSLGSILNWYYNYINLTYTYRVCKPHLKNKDLEDFKL